jgi:hypothetical protein
MTSSVDAIRGVLASTPATMTSSASASAASVPSRGPNWNRTSTKVAILAVSEANERLPEQRYVDRAKYASEAYKRIANALAADPLHNQYGITD